VNSSLTSHAITLPPGFEAATALRPASTQGNTTGYAEESLETLFDSPVFAGRHHRRVELDAPGAPRPAVLQLFADEAADLEAQPEMLEAHRELVRQADRLFGSRHYRHGYRRHGDFWFPAGAFIAGALITGAIVNNNQNRVYRGGDSHVQWCYDRYRSYRASDNTFQPNYGPRQECNSPY